MKGVPIKFRGKCKEYPKRDKFVYGDLSYSKYDVTSISYVDEKRFYHEDRVVKESVSQLIGYDDEGNEVYEGDMIDAYIDDYEEPVYTFQAVLLNNFFVPNGMPNLKHVLRKEK